MNAGEIGILNVGAGDTKLSFDPSKPDEVKRTCAIVTDMIRHGYAILVEAGRDEKGPLYRRALDFDPETAEYIVAGQPAEEEPTTHEQKPASPPKGRRRRKETRERIPAAKSSAVAVSRIAGG